MKALIDTCVSLDFIQGREPFFDDAKSVFEAIKDKKIEGFVTVKSLMDIHYVIKHCLHDETPVRSVLQDLLTLLTLVDSKSNDAQKALTSSITDYEDALMCQTALSEGMNCVVTVITPADLISIL